jgi:hypothetical protein
MGERAFSLLRLRVGDQAQARRLVEETKAKTWQNHG